MTRFACALMVLLSLVADGRGQQLRLRPTEWAQPVIGSSLENFYQVDEKLYRSAQPSGSDMATLAVNGIHDVLSLREWHSDEDEGEGVDINLHRVPMEADEIGPEEIEEALSVIHSCEGPVLVHCWHGSDRTGVVVASYRVVFQGWSFDEAWDEMVNGGYGFHELYRDHMREVLYGLDVEGIRERLGLTAD